MKPEKLWRVRVSDYHINPLSTISLLTQFLIGSYHELFTYLANHYKALKVQHQKPAHETNFSYSLSEWFNIWQSIPFDQSAGIVLMGLKASLNLVTKLQLPNMSPLHNSKVASFLQKWFTVFCNGSFVIGPALTQLLFRPIYLIQQYLAKC